MATYTTTAQGADTERTHPLYDLWAPIWEYLADVADGAGGFLTGEHLVAHPREWLDHDQDVPRRPTKKLLERRRLARYENLADVILKLKLDGVFREPAQRRVLRPNGEAIEKHPYLAWADGDVDGGGRTLDAFLRESYRDALSFGFLYLLMDRAGDDGPTAADRAPLVLRSYDPRAVPDWLDQSGTLTAVKIVEALPRASLDDAEVLRYRVYRVTAEGTTVRESGVGSQADRVVEHRFGALPVVPLYAHRRSRTSVLGQSALGDPKLYIDLYNLTSELRELLRKQTFSILNIPLGAKADGSGTAISVEQAMAMLGQTTGTANVLFSALDAKYITANAENVTTYQAERTQLIRTIFRVTTVPLDDDGRAAETAEARRLKRQDYNTTLSGYADRLRDAELAIAKLWYRGTYGDQWERIWQTETPTVSYPQSFDEPSFAEVLAQAQAALSLPLGQSATFRVEHSSRLIPSFLPDVTPKVQQTIRAELEAQPSPDAARAAAIDAMAARFGEDEEDDTADDGDDPPAPPPAAPPAPDDAEAA